MVLLLPELSESGCSWHVCLPAFSKLTRANFPWILVQFHFSTTHIHIANPIVPCVKKAFQYTDLFSEVYLTHLPLFLKWHLSIGSTKISKTNNLKINGLEVVSTCSYSHAFTRTGYKIVILIQCKCLCMLNITLTVNNTWQKYPWLPVWVFSWAMLSVKEDIPKKPYCLHKLYI